MTSKKSDKKGVGRTPISASTTAEPTICPDCWEGNVFSKLQFDPEGQKTAEKTHIAVKCPVCDYKGHLGNFDYEVCTKCNYVSPVVHLSKEDVATERNIKEMFPNMTKEKVCPVCHKCTEVV